MNVQKLYNADHQWYLLGRDTGEAENVVDTNQYLILQGDRALLIDPGGVGIFAPMLAALMKHVRLEQITDIFASHQDPDVISSLGMWDKIVPHATLHSSWLWEGFVRHYGMENIQYQKIEDAGRTLQLGDLSLELIPAHYLHSSGNFNLYDPIAKILFSGDIGASLTAADSAIFIEDFKEHTHSMTEFHQRWMPSDKAKKDWIKRVRQLDIDMMVPQHGKVFKGPQIEQFLDWFEALEVGVAIK